MKRNVITIIITTIFISAMWIGSTKASEESVPVMTIKPEIKNIYDYINADGKVKEANKHNIFVNDLAVIEEVFVKAGDKAEKDMPLAKIMPVYAHENDIIDIDIDIDEILSVFEDFNEDFDLRNNSFISLPDKKSRYIKSPIQGTVTEVNIEVGDRICALNKLISISDFSDLYIEIMIPEEYASKVKEGAQVEISGEAFGGKKYRGNIQNIKPIAKYVPSLTGNGKTYIQAIASINKPDELLKPGLTANARITANTVERTVTIPYECIMQDESNREYVYKVINNVAKKSFITAGYELENEVEIKSGVQKGDIIIFDPSNKIEENTKVKEMGK